MTARSTSFSCPSARTDSCTCARCRGSPPLPAAAAWASIAEILRARKEADRWRAGQDRTGHASRPHPSLPAGVDRQGRVARLSCSCRFSAVRCCASCRLASASRCACCSSCSADACRWDHCRRASCACVCSAARALLRSSSCCRVADRCSRAACEQGAGGVKARTWGRAACESPPSLPLRVDSPSARPAPSGAPRAPGASSARSAAPPPPC